MSNRTFGLRCVASVIVALILSCGSLRESGAAEAMRGPLAEYVAKPDASYGWKKIREGNLGATSYAELILTSQTWRDIVWKHQLFIIKPSTVSPNAKHGLLFIAGGNWREALADEKGEGKLPREAALLATVAEQLASPVAILLHVPQQPIFEGKTEDAIISYTFEEYFKSRDSEWPLLLPMVKSAVRGMDAVQAFCDQQWSLKLEAFTISGGSKRGWTTWLTGAADPRAVAIAPMVIDMLNLGPQMKHQFETWGKPSEMVADYTRRGLHQMLDTPRGKELLSIVDPYSYREKLTQPKLIVLGTNDPYWPLDALNLYWEGLAGPKHILYIPNNGHGLKDVSRLVGGLSAFHQHAAAGKPLPKLDWQFVEEDGQLKLKVRSDRPVEKVQAWTASSATRDFRQSTWTARPADRAGDDHVCQLEVPDAGCAALFGEVVFAGQNSMSYYLSTNVRIVGPGGPDKNAK